MRCWAFQYLPLKWEKQNGCPVISRPNKASQLLMITIQSCGYLPLSCLAHAWLFTDNFKELVLFHVQTLKSYCISHIQEIMANHILMRATYCFTKKQHKTMFNYLLMSQKICWAAPWKENCLESFTKNFDSATTASPTSVTFSAASTTITSTSGWGRGTI